MQTTEKEEKKGGFGNWCKKHKKKIVAELVTAGLAFAGAMTYLACRNGEDPDSYTDTPFLPDPEPEEDVADATETNEEEEEVEEEAGAE